MTEIMKVVSGGQTGVDRAALDAARDAGLPTGGWCPAQRRAEDGSIPGTYDLDETPSSDYRTRTIWNVRDSDATLILSSFPLTGGTLLTRETALDLDRPVVSVDLLGIDAESSVLRWLAEIRPGVLNVAGPRASTMPSAYRLAYAILGTVFRKENR